MDLRLRAAGRRQRARVSGESSLVIIGGAGPTGQTNCPAANHVCHLAKSPASSSTDRLAECPEPPPSPRREQDNSPKLHGAKAELDFRVRVAGGPESQDTFGRRRAALVGRPRAIRPISGKSVAYSSLLLLLLGALLSLFSTSPTTTTSLVNGARLQPEGHEKFYWSGETFVITCQNNNNLKNVKIRWAGPDGRPITEDRSKRVHAESSGPHVNRLVVRDARLDTDEGKYQCTINDADSRRVPEKVEFTLKLLRATSFMDTRSKLALETGKEEQIECRVEFDPNVSQGTVNWYKDHLPIDAQNDPSIRVLEYNPDTKLSKLVLAPVRREHEGNYTCQAQAVSAKLEKLIDFHIQLETLFVPIFDTSEQTIWVESSQALASRLASGRGHEQPATGPVHNKYTKAARTRQGLAGRPGQQSAGRISATDELQSPAGADQQQLGNNSSEVIRVELKCTCQANPAANILWFTQSTDGVAIVRGKPAHVIEEPSLEISGHNTSSTLVVAYNLDANWPHRYDTYKCSAANKLGGASKTFAIEQGNPPPAFSVGPHKAYNAETALFEFTLLGPNFDPRAPSGREQQRNIVPPVDAFRIRAELATTPPAAGQPGAAEQALGRHLEMARRQSEPSVQWAYQTNGARQPAAPGSQGPQNMTVNLGKLPSGLQRLYLEAHNAVGWSPNATHLGDFYIVSGASSLALLNTGHLLLVLACQAAVLVAYSHRSQ